MEQCSFFQESGGGWRKDEVRPLAGLSACVSFNALTLSVGKNVWPVETLYRWSRKALPEQVEEETSGTSWPTSTWKTAIKGRLLLLLRMHFRVVFSFSSRTAGLWRSQFGPSVPTSGLEKYLWLVCAVYSLILCLSARIMNICGIRQILMLYFIRSNRGMHATGPSLRNLAVDLEKMRPTVDFPWFGPVVWLPFVL